MFGALSRFVRGSFGVRTLPRWVLVVLGVICVGVGATLTTRPFTSLSVLIVLVAVAAIVTGIGDLLAAGQSPAPRLDALVGAAWLVVGVGVLAWPGLTIHALAVWVGVGLVVAGVARLLGGLLGSADQRITAVISGAAGVVFGVLALSWPDVTVLVIAVVFGARTVLFGLSLLVAGLRGHRPDDAHPAPVPESRYRRIARQWTRTIAAVASLVVALALLGVSASLHEGSPSVDAFYRAPKSIPSMPGQLLRSEPFSRAIPAGARAWRILYTTTRDDGVPALASGLVLVSTTAPSGPRPVIAWAHGTTGYAQGCAPTLLKDPLGSGALPDIDQIISNGWVLVATDYVGLGTKGPHPYLIGQGEARSVLDAVRATRQLREVSVSKQTVVWGHSQGGGAALWTGQVQPGYAPDVPLAGVAAMAPASDLLGLAGNLDKVPGGSLFMSFIVAAYTATYPDVTVADYVRPGARSIVAEAADRCLSEPSTLVSVVTSLALDKSILATPATSGAFGKRLQENTATGPIPAPLLLAQGGADPLVLPSVQKAYAAKLCASGQKLDYREYPGRDHVGVVSGDSPLLAELITWTQDRLAGRAPVDNCSTL